MTKIIRLLMLFVALCGLLGAATLRQQSIYAQETSSVRSQAGNLRAPDSGLVEIATMIERAAPDVSRVWSGFWYKDKPFVLLRPTESVLLISFQKPPDAYVPLPATVLPPELRGRAYSRQDYLPKFDKHTFMTNYEVGNNIFAPALEPKGKGIFEKLDFYYHESFHGYQDQKFVSKSASPFVRPGKPSVDPAHIAAPDFTAMVELERRILRAALNQSSRRALRSILQQYLAVRQTRSAGLTDVQVRERAIERIEGTAQFVGCRAATIATGAPASRFESCIADELVEPLGSFLNLPESDARLMRWRLYGTGAAIAQSLERLKVKWREPLQQGTASLDEMLAKAVKFDPSKSAALAGKAFENFEFEKIKKEVNKSKD